MRPIRGVAVGRPLALEASSILRLSIEIKHPREYAAACRIWLAAHALGAGMAGFGLAGNVRRKLYRDDEAGNFGARLCTGWTPPNKFAGGRPGMPLGNRGSGPVSSLALSLAPQLHINKRATCSELDGEWLAHARLNLSKCAICLRWKSSSDNRR